jgi:hypothetical protein
MTVAHGAGTRPAVVILGMHRSGTSCLTGSLQEKGLYLGRVSQRGQFNEKGNRENGAIAQLNEEILLESGGRWDKPPASVTWSDAHVPRRDEIIARFEAAAPGRWGFKDPRLLFTLPFWQERLTRVALVGSFRHPRDVAGSLRVRNHISAPDALAMWASYNRRLLAYLKDHEFPLVSFDVSAEEYLRAVERVAEHLGLEGGAGPAGASFFDAELRHQRARDESEPLPGDVSEMYQELIRIYREQTLCRARTSG